MWTVMWLDKDRGRIDYITGFKTEEDAKKYVEENNFQPEEYVTIGNMN